MAKGCATLSLWGCNSHGAPSEPIGAPPPHAAAPLAPPSAQSSAPPPAIDDASASSAQSAPQPPTPLADAERDDKPTENSRLLIDGLNDVGPAAPASAFAQGVVMITRADELSVSKLTQPPGKSRKSLPSMIEPARRGPDEFWSVARGPAVSRTHAYWVSKGRVVRRAFVGGELEVLATDARDGTRVAVAGSPDSVAYITRPVGKQDSIARLRLSDGRKLDVTPEGAAASSVALASVGDDLIASSIDGRSGMTPVHARRFRSKAAQLDPDVVVWVAGATQGQTEVSSVGQAGGSWLLLPVERDVSHFGLAALALGAEPKMDPPLRWRTYENGLDRAPAAAASVCGVATAIYVRPADARPTASQELVVSELTLAETASSEPLASARGFSDVSLYPLPEGAMLAYVADRRTWARLLRCK